MKSDTFTKLKTYVLTRDTVTLPTKYLIKQINAIVKDTNDVRTKHFIEFVDIQMEKSAQTEDLANHLGHDRKSKEFNKFKKEFLFDLKKSLKKL